MDKITGGNKNGGINLIMTSYFEGNMSQPEQK